MPNSFSLSQDALTSKVVAHYDPKLPLMLATDASPYGVATVSSHQYPNGSEQPIAFTAHPKC